MSISSWAENYFTWSNNTKIKKDPSSRAVLLVPLQRICVVDADDGVVAVYSRNTPVLL
jgi:hypothetical protein